MEVWKTLLSVIVGGAVTFWVSYLLETRKLKNEKFKFNREKIISVGEDFYRFSGYALIRFETLLHNYETVGDYETQEARNILQQTDKNAQDLLVKIGENNVTITMADLFFGVSGADNAVAMIQSTKAAQARLEEVIAKGGRYSDIEKPLDELKEILRDYIALIKDDRQKIGNKLQKMITVA